MLKDDGVEAESSKGSVHSASYKDYLSDWDQSDVAELTKGVLLTHER